MRVFLIDDSEYECSVLAEFIRDLGHQVCACTEIPAAGEALYEEGEAPDILVVGIPAQGNSGRRYLRHVTERFAHTPLIVVAEIGFMVPKESALSNDIYAFLRRPLQLEELDFLLSRFQEKEPTSER